MARAALIEEVCTAPKPGLVDIYTSGAHQDMNFNTFVQSAAVLEPFFVEMSAVAMKMAFWPKEVFQAIRQIGNMAEKCMYHTTGGVNTHKGAIFTIGILCSAVGACYGAGYPITVRNIIQMEQWMVRKTLLDELSALKQFRPSSNGQHNFVSYGSTGIRGEAIAGYTSVTELALPVLREGRKKGRDWNRVKLQALFVLMSQVEDGNVLWREGRGGLNETQRLAKRFLKDGGAYGIGTLKQLIRLDRYFSEKNYSNGGCADLLAAAIFLESVIK